MRAARAARVLDGRRRAKRHAVLSALLDGPRCGTDVARRLYAAGAARRPDADHLYAYLGRLRLAGLIEPAGARGHGPRGRTAWALTAAGRLTVCGFALRRAGPTGGATSAAAPDAPRDATPPEADVAAGMAAVLTRQQVEVAALYWHEGRYQREIAGWLGVSRGAVADRLRLVRLKLAAAGFPPLPDARRRPPRPAGASNLR